MKAFLPAKKQFSQNFLVNSNLINKIILTWVEVSKKYPGKNFLEIGPGRGALTEVLLQKTEKFVTAIEIDSNLIDFLETKLKNFSNLNLILGDVRSFLKNDLSDHIIVSNLPFKTGSRILIDLSIFNPESPFSVILQKEVVEKLFFKNHFTLFGAWLNLFYKFELNFKISNTNFYPQPKVTSSLVTAFLKKPILELQNINSRRKWFLISKKLFVNPRKNLSNNLKQTGLSQAQIQLFLSKNQLSKNFRLNQGNFHETLKMLIIFDKLHKVY